MQGSKTALPVFLVPAFYGIYLSSTAGASGSDDVDTDWDREFFGTGRTGEPSPNVARDVTRANLAEGLKALLRSAAEDPLDSKARG